jgi:TolA-binding protein
MSTGKIDQAILAYQSAITNFPDTRLKEKILFSSGVANFVKGDFERSLFELKSLLETFPDGEKSAKAKLYMAESLYNLGNYNEALSLYKSIEREIKEEDLRAMISYQIGCCYYGMGKEVQALEEFSRFLKMYPSSSLAQDARLWIGDYYRSKLKYDKAREYYYSIPKDSSSESLREKALLQAALTFQEEGKSDEAVLKLEELAIEFPGSETASNAYKKIAKIKIDRKDFDGAISFLKKALGSENNELNAQIQYEMAECLEEKGDLENAAVEYLKVPSLYSKGIFWSVRAYLKSAQILEKLGRMEEAVKLYKKLALMDVEESTFAKKRLESMKGKK